MVRLEPRLIFAAPALEPDALAALAEDWDAEELAILSPDGPTLYGWRLRAGETAERAALIFSGNSSAVGGYPRLYEALRAAGFDALHPHYRGYPGSEGDPSEAGLRADARAAWAELTREISPESAVIYGHSLGSGVAVGLAAEVQPALLVLASPYDALVDVAAGAFPWLPVRRLLRNRFDAGALAGDVACPVLILHGTADALIPPAQARRLAARFPGEVEIVWVEGAAHEADLLADPAARAALDQALAAVPGAAAPVTPEGGATPPSRSASPTAGSIPP